MGKRGKNNDSRDQYQKRADDIWKIFTIVPTPSKDLEDRIVSSSIAQGSDRETSVSYSFSWVYRIAAVLVLLIGAGIALYYTSHQDVIRITELREETVHYATNRGETKEIHLTNHIYVQLNAETELRAVAGSDESTPRLVYLNGEAYFNVMGIPRGFEVVTDAGVVQVIGTSFNVLARENRVEVAVEKGVVALRGLPDEQVETVVQIPAGHKSIKGKNAPALIPMPVQIESYLSWRRGRFVFDQTPLSDVIRNLERTYNVRIDLRGQDIEDIRVTGEFGREPLMQILNEICWSANLRYRQEEDTFILYLPE
jgi:transmembrane sensor